MKVFGKWLVMGMVDNKAHIIASFRTKKETVEALGVSGFKKDGTLWEDSKGNKFYIEKNVKEYK